MVFEPPHFTFWSVIYTALGAALFWFKSGNDDLKAYVMSGLIRMFLTDVKWVFLVETVVFVALGTLIGVGFMEPTTPKQAIIAGIAWTSAFTHYSGKQRRLRKS